MDAGFPRPGRFRRQESRENVRGREHGRGHPCLTTYFQFSNILIASTRLLRMRPKDSARLAISSFPDAWKSGTFKLPRLTSLAIFDNWFTGRMIRNMSIALMAMINTTKTAARDSMNAVKALFAR